MRGWGLAEAAAARECCYTQANLRLCALWVLVCTLFPLPASLPLDCSKKQELTKREKQFLHRPGSWLSRICHHACMRSRNLVRASNNIIQDPTKARAARSLVRSSTCRQHQTSSRHYTSSAGFRQISIYYLRRSRSHLRSQRRPWSSRNPTLLHGISPK